MFRMSRTQYPIKFFSILSSSSMIKLKIVLFQLRVNRNFLKKRLIFFTFGDHPICSCWVGK
jgi:hypothetical protein